jgi:hypothetical protein
MRSAACRIWEKLSGGEGWISEVKSQKAKVKMVLGWYRHMGHMVI